MACDIRVAAETAKFGQPECGLGIIPGLWGNTAAVQTGGQGRAKELILPAI